MMLTNLSSTLNMMSPLISSLGITLDDIAPVVESAGDTLSYVSSAMTRLQSLMTRVADACDQLLVKINEGTADERLQTLITVLNGNAEKYAEFLSSPVSVTEETIYPVASYGDAMTPFYSALAIWVGGVILTAILKVEAEPKGLRNVTEARNTGASSSCSSSSVRYRPPSSFWAIYICSAASVRSRSCSGWRRQ